MLTSIADSGNAKKAGSPDGPVFNSSFTPYTGPWEYDQAAHLLRRTMFGPASDQISWSLSNGLSATLDELFKERPLPTPPLNVELRNDPDIPFGQTWVESPFTESRRPKQMPACIRSLNAWVMGVIVEEGMSIREKLTLFWHNHFPIEAIQDPRYKYKYATLMRTHAWGDFRQLTKDMTIDPSMLRFLNGSQNSKRAPNENYARELLELFTIGKGPAAGPGDYTFFTEQDVRAISRILTGWKDRGYAFRSKDGKVGSEFQSWRHDEGTKQLSPRFGNAVITNLGDREYAYLIDLIFEQDEVSRFICRKLYQWFVYYQIDETIEVDIIEPMARILRENNYRIAPALRALLQSEHFFDRRFRGAMIKNPIELIATAIKTFKIPMPGNLTQKYDTWLALFNLADKMQMKYFEIPQVAGWRAYYLAPVYYRDWISSSTLPIRMDFVERLVNLGHVPVNGNGPRIRARPLEFIARLDNPSDPNQLIADMARLFFCFPLTPAVRDSLKEVLIPGLPDFEWTVEYRTHLARPTDTELAEAVEAKLRNLLNTMLTMAEYQLG